MPVQLDNHLEEIARFLSSPLVSSLFSFHPNHLGSSADTPHPAWHAWWDWPLQQDPCLQNEPWRLLLQYYDLCRTDPNQQDESSGNLASIPFLLRRLINQAAKLSFPRDAGRTIRCDCLHSLSFGYREDLVDDALSTSLPGMSPKKSHEVVRMSAFVEALLSSNRALSHLKQAVDIGAGQAYLSRSLRDRLGLHILALDWSNVQTEGAAKKDASKANRRAVQIAKSDDDAHAESPGSLTYVTTKIDTASLLSSTQAWLNSRHPQVDQPNPRITDERSLSKPEPVLFVALHACGSLTPDILRAFVAASKRNLEGRRDPETQSTMPYEVAEGSCEWTPRGAVVVGCCYNMMQSEDFPLSRVLRSASIPVSALTASHLQLAAQVPAQWTRSEESLRDTRLAMRKVVWRALVEDLVKLGLPEMDSIKEQGSETRVLDRDADANSASERPMTTASTENWSRRRGRRLGRLNDAAYADWGTFVRVVRTKMGLPHSDSHRAHAITETNAELERRIEVFHALRCIVGPVVESFILLDRLAWVREELQGSPCDVELVNLFDQAKGSGRNVAIVLQPAARPQS